MSVAAYGWAALALPVLVAPGSAMWGRWGLLPWLAPRRCRTWFRHLRPRGRQKSARISRALYDKVMAADRHRCVVCGLAGTWDGRWRRWAGVQVDHLVPWSLGGITCLANCMVLCRYHNIVKSNYYRADDGRVIYRGWAGYKSRPKAARIVMVERVKRLSPWRWLRAYGLLPSFSRV